MEELFILGIKMLSLITLLHKNSNTTQSHV